MKQFLLSSGKGNFFKITIFMFIDISATVLEKKVLNSIKY